VSRSGTRRRRRQTYPDVTIDAEWRETYIRDGESTLLENTTAPIGGDTGIGTTAAADEPAIIHLDHVLPGTAAPSASGRPPDPKSSGQANTVAEPTFTIDIEERTDTDCCATVYRYDRTLSCGRSGNDLPQSVWKVESTNPKRRQAILARTEASSRSS